MKNSGMFEKDLDEVRTKSKQPSLQVDKVNNEENKDLELVVFKDQDPSQREWKNRQRTLVISSRGINHIYRHLVTDVIGLIPHAKKDSKIERKTVKNEIDALCLERACNNALYFE